MDWNLAGHTALASLVAGFVAGGLAYGVTHNSWWTSGAVVVTMIGTVAHLYRPVPAEPRNHPGLRGLLLSQILTLITRCGTWSDGRGCPLLPRQEPARSG